MTLIVHCSPVDMAETQPSHDPMLNAGGASLRSRASSVISTGTKFSISTLPQENLHMDSIMNSPAARNAAHPASTYSFRALEHVLPAYEDHLHVTEALQQPLTVQTQTGANQDFPGVNGVNSSDATNAGDATPPLPPTPSTTDPENALSQHYSRIVRTIDTNHARQLARIHQTHETQLETELAATRHAIDQVYRKDFKAKDRKVEAMREEAETIREEAAADVVKVREEADANVVNVRQEAGAEAAVLRTEIEALISEGEETVASVRREAGEDIALVNEAHEGKILMMEETYERSVEKARNMVEDLWEGRWSDRTRLEGEEAKRKEVEERMRLERAVEEAQSTAVEENDAVWKSVVGERAEVLKAVQNAKRRTTAERQEGKYPQQSHMLHEISPLASKLREPSLQTYRPATRAQDCDRA